MRKQRVKWLRKWMHAMGLDANLPPKQDKIDNPMGRLFRHVKDGWNKKPVTEQQRMIREVAKHEQRKQAA